jgi:hypothetical protein
MLQFTLVPTAFMPGSAVLRGLLRLTPLRILITHKVLQTLASQQGFIRNHSRAAHAPPEDQRNQQHSHSGDCCSQCCLAAAALVVRVLTKPTAQPARFLHVVRVPLALLRTCPL